MVRISSNKEKAEGGEKLVQEFLIKKYLDKGYTAKRVSGQKGKHWDLELIDTITGKTIKTIEVKTTSSESFTIVDLSEKQIIEKNDKYTLNFDELWIVVNFDKKPEMYKMTRNDFTKMLNEYPDAVKPKLKWWINDTIGGKFSHPEK